ncbi:MAG: uncharacterized protein A8A55_2550 [Amphiamblys sp. WSBS2006]|nr:MAG: uncharacterized protein A8A55_2550 [Amphiamblys sp. WSBS2006]
MERIVFGEKGLSVLSIITNKKINVRHMEVMDIVKCLSNEEKEKIKKKEFVIRERLYMKNTGIFFMELLGETVFIPVIEIVVDCYTEYWGRFEKTIGVHVETNALLGKISPGIKQNIEEIVAQKKVVVENKPGYQKLVFEEDPKHEEQRGSEESSEQPGIEYQELEEFKEDPKHEEQNETGESEDQPSTEHQEPCFKENPKRCSFCYDFSNYRYESYED